MSTNEVADALEAMTARLVLSDHREAAFFTRAMADAARMGVEPDDGEAWDTLVKCRAARYRAEFTGTEADWALYASLARL